MRNLTYNELGMVNGGVANNGYNFSYIVENTLAGVVIGLFFPNIAITLGITKLIPYPPVATGALLGTYALVRVGAKCLDQYLFDEPVVKTTV